MSRGPGKWQLAILRALRRPGLFPLRGATAAETSALLRAALKLEASGQCVVIRPAITAAAPRIPVNFIRSLPQIAENRTGWPRLPCTTGATTSSPAGAAAMLRNVEAWISGRSPGNISQAGAVAVARTPAAIESPIPG